MADSPTTSTSAHSSSASASPTAHQHHHQGSSSSSGLPSTTTTAGSMLPAGMELVRWEEEMATVIQYSIEGEIVARRIDTSFVNGTKMLNLVDNLTRGRRDSALKNIRERIVVLKGPRNLKGVWIPLEHAIALANRFDVHHKVGLLLEPSLASTVTARLAIDPSLAPPIRPARHAHGNSAVSSARRRALSSGAHHHHHHPVVGGDASPSSTGTASPLLPGFNAMGFSSPLPSPGFLPAQSPPIGYPFVSPGLLGLQMQFGFLPPPPPHAPFGPPPLLPPGFQLQMPTPTSTTASRPPGPTRMLSSPAALPLLHNRNPPSSPRTHVRQPSRLSQEDSLSPPADDVKPNLVSGLTASPSPLPVPVPGAGGLTRSEGSSGHASSSSASAAGSRHQTTSSTSHSHSLSPSPGSLLGDDAPSTTSSAVTTPALPSTSSWQTNACSPPTGASTVAKDDPARTTATATATGLGMGMGGNGLSMAMPPRLPYAEIIKHAVAANAIAALSAPVHHHRPPPHHQHQGPSTSAAGLGFGSYFDAHPVFGTPPTPLPPPSLPPPATTAAAMAAAAAAAAVTPMNAGAGAGPGGATMPWAFENFAAHHAAILASSGLAIPPVPAPSSIHPFLPSTAANPMSAGFGFGMDGPMGAGSGLGGMGGKEDEAGSGYATPAGWLAGEDSGASASWPFEFLDYEPTGPGSVAGGAGAAGGVRMEQTPSFEKWLAPSPAAMAGESASMAVGVGARRRSSTGEL